MSFQMLRAAPLAVLSLVLGACSQTPPAPRTTTTASMGDAPPASPPQTALPASPAAPPASASLASPASASASSSAGLAADAQGVDARYRACTAAADCVAVEPVGCCHNGQMVAVSTAQKDAYLASFTCPQKRPLCPMYRRLPDGRVASCEAALCVMKAP